MSGTIINHPAPAVERAARELVERAEQSGDTATARRIQRAAADLLAGATVAVVSGGYETSSASTPGAVYTIDAIERACSCPARGACRHQARIDVLERAALYVLPTVEQVRAQDTTKRQQRAARAVADMLDLWPAKIAA